MTRKETTSSLRRCGLFLAAFFALFAVATAANADGVSQSAAGERVDLLAGSGFEAEHPMLFGVRMVMKEGWHTYWRQPGDSGIAPRFDWSASKNVAAVKLLWPVPQRFDVEGDMTAGYAREVIWPVLVRAADAKKPMRLALEMNYGVCADICVPGQVRREVIVSPGFVAAPETGKQIRGFLTRVPAAPKNESDVSARLAGDVLHVRLKGVTETPALILEGPRGVWFGKPQATADGDALDYAVPVEVNEGTHLAGAEVTLTFSGPVTAIEAVRDIE